MNLHDTYDIIAINSRKNRAASTKGDETLVWIPHFYHVKPHDCWPIPDWVPCLSYLQSPVYPTCTVHDSWSETVVTNRCVYTCRHLICSITPYDIYVFKTWDGKKGCTVTSDVYRILWGRRLVGVTQKYDVVMTINRSGDHGRYIRTINRWSNHHLLPVDDQKLVT